MERDQRAKYKKQKKMLHERIFSRTSSKNSSK
jgi:hypothetical protein